MAKPIPEHRDKLGRILQVGDAVCFPDRNSLEFGKVKKLNDKMITVWEMGVHSTWYRGCRKYPGDLIKVEGPEVTLFLLKNSS